MRSCKTCGTEKPLSDYYAHERYRGGRKPTCKACEIASQAEYQRRPEVRDRRNEWSRQNRVRTPEELLRQRLWSWYRLTIEGYEALLASQSARCAICKTDEPGGRGRWHVDHDHACCSGSRSCGECVRGLLCSRCNPLLGMARDDTRTLRAAIAYLDNDNAAMSAMGAIGEG